MIGKQELSSARGTSRAAGRRHRARATACTAALLAVAGSAACGALERGLVGHAEPAAEAVGLELTAGELGRIMAESPVPDSALSPLWARRYATLWADYVRLAALYRAPDTTLALDYEPLLEGQRYYDAFTVRRFRDSLVFGAIDPTEEEIRAYAETRRPFARLDVRRIRMEVPEDAPDALRDSLRRQAERAREAIAAGASFEEVAATHSDDPPAVRGRLLRFRGHEDFSPEADSVLFTLEPGELSPVIRSGDTLLIYLVENVREPTFEESREQIRGRLVQERRDQAALGLLDSLLESAARSVRTGAIEIARNLSEDPTLEVMGVAPATPLVSWNGGHFTAGELRELFRVREDLQMLFRESPDEQIDYYLMQLAQDEILTRAAYGSGMGVTPQERKRVQTGAAAQLAGIARNLGISHALITAPAYDVRAESHAFLEEALAARREMPWLGAYRVALDPDYPASVDETGLERASRIARRIREQPAGAGPLTS